VKNSYPIKIWSGLLSDGHTKKIENALWEFIWLINKVTKEEKGIGYVLKGRPIKVEEIAKDLDRNYRSVLRHLKKLEKEGYIDLKRCPYGFVITIKNSKKFSNRYDNNVQSGHDKTIQSDSGESVQKCHGDMTKMSRRVYKNVQNKEDIKDIKDINNIKDIFNFWNSKEIIVHRKLDEATKTKIVVKLKDYTLDEIKDAIHNYDFILKSKEHWFNYRWTLKDFLQRGLEKFKDADVAYDNYLKEKR
jgi:DNA-binding transcriptional ArsR family regulator